MKTELLMQMEGLCNSKDLVFLLAASNLPWSVFGSNLFQMLSVFIPSTFQLDIVYSKC